MDRSTSGKYFLKSSTCVKDNEELFSLTLILIVSPEIKKNYGFWLNRVISCFLPISPCNMGISFYWWITCFDQASQYPPSLFFATLFWHPKPARSPFFVKTWQWLFTHPVASFNAFSWDITPQLLKNDKHFLLQSICFCFTGNAYYI